MEFIVELKTKASHDKEYQQLEFSNWNPYKIEGYKKGDSLPADSIFLCKADDFLLFKIPRPKPRSLPVLDMEIKNKVSLYFQPDVTTATQFDLDLRKFVETNIFTSEDEKLWYYRWRQFGATLDEKVTTIVIGGRS